MAARKSIAAPRPEVLHLPTLLRRVEAGEIRVPDFQRKYVWTEKQVIELLESVYRGYPIGSLLFWRSETTQLRYATGHSYPLPVVEKARSPVSFLLDGQQRLTTLYGCLFLPKERRGEVDVFNVVFDLRSRRFTHWSPELNKSGVIALSALFSPTDFLEAQRELQGEKDAAALLDESVQLHAVFQEYMVPLVTIEKRPVNEVVEIFERVNRTGTQLSSVDFMRAVTWSGGFDLGHQVENLTGSVEKLGFEIKQETLVKAVAVALGAAPIPEQMLELKKHSAAKLLSGVQKAGTALQRVVEFLKSELAVHADVFVPYEGQYLVLLRLLLEHEAGQLTAKQRTAAARWFLATSLNEGLRGKPDHVVAGLVMDAGKLADGALDALDSKPRIARADLLKRKLIQGKALSMGVVNVLSLSQPRSLYSGKPISSVDLTSEFMVDRFVSIVPASEFEGGDEAGPRSLANIAVVSARDAGRLTGRTVLERLLRLQKVDKGALDGVLSSHLISPRAFEALKAGKLRQFLEHRADAIVAQAKALFT